MAGLGGAVSQAMKSRLRPFTFPTHLVWRAIAHSTQVISFLIPQAGAPDVFFTSTCQDIGTAVRVQSLYNYTSLKRPLYTVGRVFI